MIFHFLLAFFVGLVPVKQTGEGIFPEHESFSSFHGTLGLLTIPSDFFHEWTEASAVFEKDEESKQKSGLSPAGMFLRPASYFIRRDQNPAPLSSSFRAVYLLNRVLRI